MSLNTTPAPNTLGAEQPQGDRTNSLLNLLKFNHAAPSSTALPEKPPPVERQQSDQLQPVSASDLVASLARQSSARLAQRASSHGSNAPSAPTSAGASPQEPKILLKDNPQNMLLNLLKRPQNGDAADSTSKVSPAEVTATQREITPAKVFGQVEGKRSPSFHAPQPAPLSARPMFTYVNPFEKLEASNSRNQSPRLEARPVSVAKRPESTQKDPPATSPLADFNTGMQVSEEMGDLAAQEEATETVTHALNEVADQANKDAQDALANIEPTQEEIKDAVHEAAAEIRDELEDGKTKADLDKKISSPIASALKDAAEGVATNGVADDWERAAAGFVVPVHNLPMRPRLSISIKAAPDYSVPVRQEVIMKVASLKKEFDQIDRCLTTATGNFIIYVMPKGGGFRAIRQDDGTNKIVFRRADNQIFNVSASPIHPNSTKRNHETVLATSTNGSVNWTVLPVENDELDTFETEEDADLFTDTNLDEMGFVLPPPPAEESISNIQLKTRAKLSFRHRNLFGVARGKCIHLVNPGLVVSDYYTDPRSRVVDSQRYFGDRDLKISTGKASKDFTFSADDTVIVSLDKQGVLKFWDTAPFLAEAEEDSAPGSRKTIEVTDPIMTYQVAFSSQRAWPTSVQFVDKERPIAKGCALRYLLVGMKQNHIIQLWDVGIGRAVQELNLPHETETDAICSIAYHAKSTMIIVGHPTRNSIYLIHLSTPLYTLPPMPQNQFLRRLAAQDPKLPRPEATAIMSGIREISLDPLGRLRSLDILSPHQITLEKDEQGGDRTVFEVYAMHSRGVTCLSLKKLDIGWGEDGKIIDAHDAEKEGLISIEHLQETTPIVEPDRAENPSKDLESRAPTALVKDQSGSVSDSSKVMNNDRPGKPEPNGGDRVEKKKKKKQQEATENLPESFKGKEAISNGQLKASPSAASTEPRSSPKKPSKPLQHHPPEPLSHDTPNAGKLSQTSVDDGQRKEPPVTPLPTDFAQVIGDHLASLYRRIDEDKRVQEAASAAKQDAVLRLVSSTLTDNVEKSLSRIVSANIQESLVPSLSNVASSALDRQLPKSLSLQVGNSLPKEIKAALSGELAKVFKDASILHTISEQVTAKIANSIDKQFKAFLEQNVISNFRSLAAESAKRSIGEVERHVNEQLRLASIKHQSDGAKIDQLTKAVGDLSEIIHTMARSQADFQKEALRPQQSVAQAESAAAPEAPLEPKDEELETIRDLMSSGMVEEGTIKVIGLSQWHLKTDTNSRSGCNPPGRRSSLRKYSSTAIQNIFIMSTKSSLCPSLMQCLILSNPTWKRV